MYINPKMRIVCVMPVRNEDWVLGLTGRAALMWCDAILFLDNGSTDETPRIIAEICGEQDRDRTAVLRLDGEWREMEHRQVMLQQAREMGATHIAMLDADEIITGNLVPQMHSVIPSASGWTLDLPQFNIHGFLDYAVSGGVWANNFTPVLFRDDPRLHWCAAADGYQHHARAPMGMRLRRYRPFNRGDGGVMHLQMLDERRLKAKHLLYQINEMLRWPGRKTAAQVREQYSLAIYGDSAGFPVSPIKTSWWQSYEALRRHIFIGGEPWQLAEAKRLIADNPGIMEGLDGFGLL